MARFRYERENELHEQLSERFDSKKSDWAERLEIEFAARETAAQKAIMSEIDGRLRNERITHETDLDLLKEETVLELEAEMESRLAEFRDRKEAEVASQLERQLDKREEIMRNKALIEVRKREANIRAEIESQLGVKRAEVRDRLSSLTQQMDDFRSMAELKMRESIEGKVQGEIDSDEERLLEQEKEYKELQQKDNVLAKRQNWLQAISGQGTQAQSPTMPLDPSALGARPDSLGAAAGRPVRGALAQAAAQHQPSMGLAGMRAPKSAAKSLSGNLPMPTPVKAPISGGLGGPMKAGVALPQPIHQKVIRQPVAPQPVAPQPVAPQPVVAPQPIEPQPQEIPEIEEVPEMLDLAEPETDSTMEDMVDELLEEAVDDDLEIETTGEVMLTPITILEVSQGPVISTLNPVDTKVLEPVKRRGPPPSSAPGIRPGSGKKEPENAVIKPIQKLTPLIKPATDLVIEEPSEEDDA